MKYSNIRAFDKHLEGAAPHHFAEIYMVLAKEAFIRKTAIDLLTTQLLRDENTPDMCCHVFDAEEHTIENVLHELHAFSFFGKKRLVLLHNVDKLDKASTEKLEAYFDRPNRSLYFVISATGINRATRFYKKAEKSGVILDIAEEKPWEKEQTLTEWIHEKANQHGKKIDGQAVRLLLQQLGLDQTLLDQEIEKLFCYVGERIEITSHDVTAICSRLNIENGWQLGEAIFRKDRASALRIGKALLTEGVALIALLRQIRSQFQTEYQVCSILSNGGSRDVVSQQFPYMKGQILERHMQLAMNYGMQNFKKGIQAIDEAELQAKNSAINLELLAEMLLVRLSS
jgi:DNA polymerase-3 subunit delta